MQNPSNFTYEYWQQPPPTPIVVPCPPYPIYPYYPVQQQVPVPLQFQQPNFIPVVPVAPAHQTLTPLYSSITTQFPFTGPGTPKSNVDIFGRPIFPPCVYKSPQTISYSSVESKFKNDFGAAIHNACLNSEQLLPDGIFLGRGRYSQAAVDHLRKRAIGQTNKDEGYGYGIAFKNYEVPDGSRNLNREYVQNSRLRCFQDWDRDNTDSEFVKRRFLIPNPPKISRKPSRPDVTLRRYYSKLPNSGGYFMRRRDLERLPADYLHERDLIEVVDYPETDIPNLRRRRSLHDNCGRGGIVIRDRPEYWQRGPPRQPQEPFRFNPLTLKSSTPWKGFNYLSPKTQETLEREGLSIGKNKRSFDDPGTIHRKMGPVKFQGFEQQETFLYPNESSVTSFAFGTSWASPYVRERDPAGPPISNDEPRDYSRLMWSQGLIPMDYSTRRNSFVGNFPNRVTPLDMEKLRIHRAAEKFATKDMIVHSAKLIDPGSGQSACPCPSRSQSAVQVGSIDEIELTPHVLNSNSNQSAPECNTIFKRDWNTSQTPVLNQYSGNSSTEVEAEPEDVRPSTTAPPSSRQRRARSRMTAGQGFRLKCGVTLTNAKYYCIPPVEELHAVTDSEGNCFVRNFTVGHVEFGNVVFPGEINVAGLNLDTTVQFAHEELVVYPNPKLAPRIGDGLNRPAIVTLERVWPKESAQDGQQRVSLEAFEKALRKVCQNLNRTFVSYDGQTGRWVFKMPHFMD